MKIINSSDKQNGYLTFEALKYLASLLCHKKFATEFIASSGLQVCSLNNNYFIYFMLKAVCS